MLYELLAKQYEAARLDEARDASLIQTLDAAIVPEKPYSPKHGRLAAIAMAIAFFLAILFAFARNAFLKASRATGF
ncbi:GNVR domain-containing protein [Massilia phosphatilytica]